MRRCARRPALAALLVAVGAGLAWPAASACKGEDATPPAEGRAAQQVEVTLRDFAIELPASLRPGPTTFRVVNAGPSTHNFAILGPEGETAVVEAQLPEPLESNGTATLSADLKPGQYRAWCPVKDHADHGMTRKFVVER